MTPQLIATLGSLSLLNQTELSIISATATTLARHGTTDEPIARTFSLLTPIALKRSVAVRSNGSSDRARSRSFTSRSDLLATNAWATPERVDPDLFASASYRARVGNTVPTLCYIASADGLRALAEKLGRTLFKGPGLTEGETVALRLATLAASRYGSCVCINGEWIEEDGFGHFEAAALPLQRRRGKCSPVKPALRAIAFNRPTSLPLQTMDRKIVSAFESASLRAFAGTAEAQSMCRNQGLEPAWLYRYTPPILGRSSRTRPRKAIEICSLAPRSEADLVADLIERVIAEHVMAIE